MATFLEDGRAALTIFAQGAERLKIWADAFERRGGTPVMGEDALAIVAFNNELRTWLDSGRLATISKYRVDVPDA